MLGLVTILDDILKKLFIRKASRIDDNFVDRLNRYYTVLFVMFYNMVAMSEDMVGDPLYCWLPTEFEEVEVKYVTDLCWVTNTYYIPLRKDIPANYERRREDSEEIMYYQWVPVIMFFMAFMFYLPRLVWRLLMINSGFELKKMCQAATKSITVPTERREKVLRDMACFVDCFCTNVTPYRGGFLAPVRERVVKHISLGCGRHYGNYFICCKIFVRFLTFANVFGHLFFLNEFLGNRFYLFGFEVLDGLWHGNPEWTTSIRFPRVTLCDFDRRQMNNVQRYTVQCVLPFNLYNEKFFLFLWFWFFIVSILSLFNLLLLIGTTVVPHMRESFVKKYLKMIGVYNQTTPRRVHAFIHSYLKQDGVFVLKQMASSSSTVIAQDMTKNLWELFEKRYEMPKIYNKNHSDKLTELPATEPLLESNGILRHITEEELKKRHRSSETSV